MKKCFGKITVVMLIVALLMINFAQGVFAKSTADAKEAIDEARLCSLRLTYKNSGEINEGQPFGGLEIQVFRFASVTSDFQYSLIDEFAGYSIEINKIKAQSEWTALANTIGSYIIADNIAPTQEQITDDCGVVLFQNLKVGLYYIRWTENQTEDNVTGFAPFILAVPGLNDNGYWMYDIDAFPKPGYMPGTYSEYSVIKEWRDTGVTQYRPHKVTIDIYKNGTLEQTVDLSPDNRWLYQWTSTDDAVWTVVERDVPEHYTVTIDEHAGKFVVTNTTTEDDPGDVPETGETEDMIMYLIILLVAGAVLVIFGIMRKKASDDK